MDNSTVATLLQLVEPLAALSSTHLTPVTRRKLAAGELSVTAYPNEYGGFVYVGAPRFNVPGEAELAAIFEVAGQAGIVWLKFDGDAGVVDGLPVFDEEESGCCADCPSRSAETRRHLVVAPSLPRASCRKADALFHSKNAYAAIRCRS